MLPPPTKSAYQAKAGKDRPLPGQIQAPCETQTALSPSKALLAAGLGLAVFAGIRSLTSSDDD
jgi:hypothetical protein